MPTDADHFEAFAADLPGVADVDYEFGLADTFLTVEDVNATVTLDGDCSPTTMGATVETVRTWIADPSRTLRIHPVVNCNGDAVGVSPVASVTETRLKLLAALLEDPVVEHASVSNPQRGDDYHYDEDNSQVNVLLDVARSTSLAGVLEMWGARATEFVQTANLTVDGSDRADGSVSYPGYVTTGMREAQIFTEGSVSPEVLAAVTVVEQLEAATGFAVYATSGPGEMWVLVPDASARPGVLAQLAPVSGPFETVEVTAG